MARSSPPLLTSRPAPSSADRLQKNQGTDPTLSGGDIDARWEDAESGGDETVGGSTATPGRNDLDEIGEAMSVAYADGEELKVGENEEGRDSTDGSSIRPRLKITQTARKTRNSPDDTGAAAARGSVSGTGLDRAKLVDRAHDVAERGTGPTVASHALDLVRRNQAEDAAGTAYQRAALACPEQMLVNKGLPTHVRAHRRAVGVPASSAENRPQDPPTVHRAFPEMRARLNSYCCASIASVSAD